MIISDIKKTLINNPDKLVELLSKYGYCNIKVHNGYISFGRAIDSSAKAIVINLKNNTYLWVKDYPQNKSQDLISYIIDERKTTFGEVLNSIKVILGISDYIGYYKPRTAFGGFYDKIKTRTDKSEMKTYDESYLNQFERCGNLRFLRDHISLKAQKHFGIMYDLSNNGIVIPIRNEIGSLVGVKIRCNYDLDTETFQKYWFMLPCMESQTLYGYYDNYEHLTDGTVYVLESEKGVMQGWSYGYYNCVGLGSGTISTRQIQMIMQLNPKRVVFLHDQGYSFDAIRRNMMMLYDYNKYSELDIQYWDWSMSNWKKKMSPTDDGKETFEYILENELKEIDEVPLLEE